MICSCDWYWIESCHLSLYLSISLAICPLPSIFSHRTCYIAIINNFIKIFLRHFLTKYLLLKRSTNSKLIKKIIIICLILALFHSILPLISFKWSNFQLNILLSLCSIELNTSSISLFVNLIILINVYYIPLIIICVFTIKTILLIRKNIILASNTNNILNILILMFVLAWSPNVLIISNKIFINSTTTITTTPVVLELTNAVCIKTSMIWSSLFYLFTIQKLN